MRALVQCWLLLRHAAAGRDVRAVRAKLPPAAGFVASLRPIPRQKSYQTGLLLPIQGENVVTENTQVPYFCLCSFVSLINLVTNRRCFERF